MEFSLLPGSCARIYGRGQTPSLGSSTAIARIIDPGAFLDDLVVHPPDLAEVLRLRLKLQQARAMSKAQEVLKYLGVNTETDWFAILGRLTEP